MERDILGPWCPQCGQPHGCGVGHVVVVRMACLLCRKTLPAGERGLIPAHHLKDGRECLGSHHPGHFLDVVVWPVLTGTPDIKPKSMIEAIALLKEGKDARTSAGQ